MELTEKIRRVINRNILVEPSGFTQIDKNKLVEDIQHLINSEKGELFNEEDMSNAFGGGTKFERGENESWETYNKLTGNQKPNKELDWNDWFKKYKESKTKI